MQKKTQFRSDCLGWPDRFQRPQRKILLVRTISRAIDRAQQAVPMSHLALGENLLEPILSAVMFWLFYLREPSALLQVIINIWLCLKTVAPNKKSSVWQFGHIVKICVRISMKNWGPPVLGNPKITSLVGLWFPETFPCRAANHRSFQSSHLNIGCASHINSPARGLNYWKTCSDRKAILVGVPGQAARYLEKCGNH